MSLINDALKKAQTLQVRTPGANAAFPRATTPVASAPATGSMDPVGAQAVPPAMPRAKTKSSQAGVVIAIASVVLVVGLGAIGYVVYALFFMSTPADDIAPAVAAPASAPAETQPAPAPEPAPAAVAPVATSAPVAPAPAPVAATPAPAPTPAPASTDAPVPAVAEVAASEPEPFIEEEPAVPEFVNNPAPHISAWVMGITVTGIRGGDRPKALMNDRVFMVGDTVNHELALRLIKVDPRVLVFQDAEGNTYEYKF